MERSDHLKDRPVSLFLTITDTDQVANAEIHDTSNKNTRAYITRELGRVRDHDVIPDHMIAEYRFPDRKDVPPLDPGFKNEYYALDLYPTVDDRTGLPRQYISLRMAAFLERNNADVLQPEKVYGRISECPEFKAFEYTNRRGLHKQPQRLNANDVATLFSIRSHGGPTLGSILSGQDKQKKSRQTSRITKKPYTPAQRHISLNPKPARSRGRSL